MSERTYSTDTGLCRVGHECSATASDFGPRCECPACRGWRGRNKMRRAQMYATPDFVEIVEAARRAMAPEVPA